jgi:hypothetical protein
MAQLARAGGRMARLARAGGRARKDAESQDDVSKTRLSTMPIRGGGCTVALRAAQLAV